MRYCKSMMINVFFLLLLLKKSFNVFFFVVVVKEKFYQGKKNVFFSFSSLAQSIFRTCF